MITVLRCYQVERDVKENQQEVDRKLQLYKKNKSREKSFFH